MKRTVQSRPWELWVPGALSKRQMIALNSLGLISTSTKSDMKIGACSMDLSLSDDGFQMVGGSVKPSAGHPYDKILNKRILPNSDGSFTLSRRNTYVFKLQQRFNPKIAEAKIYGQATAKSSIGRLDVLARLIVDRMDRYECFDPEHLKKSSGNLYVEITPITFHVKVSNQVNE